MFQKFSIAIFSLLLVICSSAQMPSALIFSRLTKKDGLASNSVSQAVRDKQGFLWIATQNGLQRYDGNRFITFRHLPGDSTTIARDAINRLFIDSKNRLWIVFDKQAGIFNTSSLKFIETKIGVPVFQTKKIMEDGQGRILLFADNKQFVYDESKGAFSHEYPLPLLPAGYNIGDMTIDPSTGYYWFTGKQGSLLYNPATRQFHYREQNSSHKIPDSIAAIRNARYPFIAKDSAWWVVNWIPFTGPAPVLFRYDKKKNRLFRFEKIRAYKADSYYEIWSIFQQGNGTIWIYGMGLLAYYNLAENRFIHINSNPFQQDGIDYDYVSNLYEDKESNVWVSTNKGLYRFNTDAQVFHNIPNKRINDTTSFHNAVSAIVQTKNNGIWVSTWGAGVFSYNNQFHPIPNPVTTLDPLNKGLHASYMIQRRNGEIWIGTQYGGLKIYDPAINKCFSVAQSLLTGKIISQLFEDHSGNVWIGSTSGMLVRCEGGNWKDTAAAFKNILPESADIMKLYEDSRHHLWVCTASDGLYEIDSRDGHIIKHYGENADNHTGLLNNGATDVIQYNDSTFIIASGGLCMLDYNKGVFKYLTAADGLPAEQATNIIRDRQNRLWITLDGGLYRLNIDNNLYVSYDAADGITNDIFQVASATLLQDGKIAVGTPYDFLVFDPEKTIDRKPVPPVRITGIVLGTSALPVDSLLQLGKLKLSYDNTFISVKLSTLSLRDDYYTYYMLEGLDKTWKQVYNNEIIYQYLPPGSYTLRLKSKNGDGIESKEITSLIIQVTSPFWETWWFYCALALVMVALLFWIDHIRIKRRTAILQMRSNIADGLHQDINSALDNITILSEIARMKAENEPERSKEFIEQIRTKSRNMSLAMGDILWSINPGNDRMMNFILRYREYLESLKTENNVQIDLLVDKNVDNLQLPMKARTDVFWLFKGGARNVIKSGARACRIHITFEKPYLVYTLEFDTAAVDKKLLNNLRQRDELTDKLEDLDAKLVYKEHTTSAVFILSIPVKKDAL